jgi:glycosyltransferase involved in cell wall biosynthesis
MSKIVIAGGFAESLWRFRGPLIRLLAERGHEVVAGAPMFDEKSKRRVRELGARPVQLDLDRRGKNPVLEFRRLLSLQGMLDLERPDIYFGYTIKPVVLGSIAAARAGVPRIVSMITGLGFANLSENMGQRFFSATAMTLYRVALRFNDRVIFQNHHDADYFVARRIVKNAGRTSVVDGSGVDIDYYRPLAFPDRVSFLLMARLIREKGVVEFAEAAARLRKRFPAVRFKIAGWFEEGRSAITREQVEKWVAQGHLEYLGVVEDVREALADSTAVVLPSYYPEGVPRSILEGMATGRPVITSDRPGCRETTVDGRNGYLVPAKDVERLCDAMERLIVEPDLAIAMGREGRKIVEDRFDSTIVNQKVVEVLLDA